MWITLSAPHIWIKYTRFTPNLWLVTPTKREQHCGCLMDNLSTSDEGILRLLVSFPYLGFYEIYPLYMGVTRSWVVRLFGVKMPLLSTGEGTFPQITGTYPQIGGLGGGLLSKQLTQDMGFGSDISDSNTSNL